MDEKGKKFQTVFNKGGETKHDWYIIDASGKTLGRVAAVIAATVRGKNKPTYTPNEECGDYVVVINADKVVVSGKKETDMLYRHYTGYVGGLKSESFGSLLARKPTEPLRKTVWGMLPHNRLGRKLVNYIKIYAGSEHPHVAQNPKPLEV
ncbi:MAG: 50S ribosomal protein L13 [Treponema sp.]|nr:50S ribosomal protein L13 [Treponema sp.]